MGALIENIGHMVGIGGGMNQYNAKAPTNDFQATPYSGMQTSDYGGAISQAMGAQGGIQSQQQALASALASQAAGNGPSLAQPLLQAATDQNSQLAAGQMASARGMNAGLAARQIGMQRAGIQQGSAQQAALLRNQEQLGAQGMLGSVLGQMGNQNLGMFGAAGSLQQGQNQLGAQNWWESQRLNQSTAAQNANLNLGAQQINAGVANQNADQINKNIGGLLNGASGAAGQMIGSGGSAGAGGAAGGAAAVPPVPASSGGAVPGKAQVPGDHPANDTVDASLSPGEIVLPRSVTQSASAPELAAEFVKAIRRKHYAQGGEVPTEGYGRVLAIQREHEQRLKRLEATRKTMGKKK